jgi:hypothetical protein
MSEMGQKETCCHQIATSALPLKADIPPRHRDVSFGPKADVSQCGARLHRRYYSSLPRAFGGSRPFIAIILPVDKFHFAALL